MYTCLSKPPTPLLQVSGEAPRFQTVEARADLTVIKVVVVVCVWCLWCVLCVWWWCW